MLAGCPFWVVHGGPDTRHSLGNSCETRVRSERPPGEVPRGRMEKRGSDEAGSAALGVVAFCFAFSYRARLGQAQNKKDASARGPSAARLLLYYEYLYDYYFYYDDF